MAKRPKHDRQGKDEAQPPPPESPYRVTHYGNSRNFAVYEGDDLLIVAVYRRGAAAIKARLEAKDRRIAELESRFAAVQEPPPSPAPPPAEPAPVWRPPQQLLLLQTTESRRPSRPASHRKMTVGSNDR